MNKEHEVTEKKAQETPIDDSAMVTESAMTTQDETSIAGSEGEELFEDLLADVDVMYTYARRRGIVLAPGLLEDISRLMARKKSHREVNK